MTTTETREALMGTIWPGCRTHMDDIRAALAAHEAAVKAEAVAEVIEFLDSQTGPDEIIGYAHLAARAVQTWADPKRIEQEAHK